MSDPTFSDIDFKNKMAWVWTTLKNFFYMINQKSYTEKFFEKFDFELFSLLELQF